MRPSELQIGDWVFVAEYDEYTPAPHNKPYPVQILHGADIDRSDEVTFEPIPLTPEIMGKNGWKWRTRYDIESLKLLSEDGHCLMSLTYGKKISVGGHEIEIKYVHELQHALRLCGLDELADNFKV